MSRVVVSEKQLDGLFQLRQWLLNDFTNEIDVILYDSVGNTFSYPVVIGRELVDTVLTELTYDRIQSVVLNDLYRAYKRSDRYIHRT